jgi:predicted XRE-type DNA-binding protein
MNKSVTESIIESKGNVFADLGFEPAEAAILKMRADLLNDLRVWAKQSGLTRGQIGKQLQLTPARVADLLRGDWEKFSLEGLIILIARVGRTVSLKVAA